MPWRVTTPQVRSVLCVLVLTSAAGAQDRSAVRRPVLAISPAESFAWAAGSERSTVGVGPSASGPRQNAVGPPPAEFRRSLARVRRALAPVCRKRCGAVRLVRDDVMASAGQARPGPGYTALVVNPANVRGWRMAFGHEGPTLVVAHEYGHHLDIHNQLGGVASGEVWPQELLADIIAGCALSRSGVSRRTLRRAERRLLHAGLDHHPHPHGADVSRALWAGYTRCEGRTPPTLEELVRETRDVWRVHRPGPLMSTASARR
jgi:hypothetical protein